MNRPQGWLVCWPCPTGADDDVAVPPGRCSVRRRVVRGRVFDRITSTCGVPRLAYGGVAGFFVGHRAGRPPSCTGLLMDPMSEAAEVLRIRCHPPGEWLPVLWLNRRRCGRGRDD